MKARRRWPWALALAPLLALAPWSGAGRGPGPGDPEATGGAEPVAPVERRVDHLIIISVDGLRPDAIVAYGLRTLGRLMGEGAYTLEARSVVPARTLPAHTSMLTGTTVETHGISWNRRTRGLGVVGVPTVFELARAEGLHTAAFYAKAKFRHLDRPHSYDYREAPSSNLDNWMSTDVVPAAVRYVRHVRPDLMFVHIPEPDYAGHMVGWMTGVYGLAARRADAAVGRILEAAERAYGPGGFTVIVTSDHGGVGRGHGGIDPLETTIPWIVYGQGVRRGARPSDVHTMDTAATALWLLGIPLPPWIEGRAVVEAFTAAAIPVR